MTFRRKYKGKTLSMQITLYAKYEYKINCAYLEGLVQGKDKAQRIFTKSVEDNLKVL